MSDETVKGRPWKCPNGHAVGIVSQGMLWVLTYPTTLDFGDDVSVAQLENGISATINDLGAVRCKACGRWKRYERTSDDN